MNRLLALSATLALLAPLPALAVCSAEEATAKREQLAAEVHQATESDPQKAKQVNEELKQDKLKTDAREGDDECNVTEQRKQEVDKAGDKSDAKQKQE
ncbi:MULTISPECIES: hypothetical protein [unclassified Pseudomonas]|uniref:hypothetical protein n=1 Tax=unclassified Pseudomonas TaxID=196821 RepID=UPI0021E0DC45|nr:MULTISPECIES: hypothetical protein [unclassified Pseudomonas]MCU9949939.1 hypothetical protein [Pseudomonas sp. PDM13]MDU9415730.1 hypothetical protein [Pseudomonas sp. zfem005]